MLKIGNNHLMRTKSPFISGALTLYLGGGKTEVKIPGIRYQVTLKSRDLWFGFFIIFILCSPHTARSRSKLVTDVVLYGLLVKRDG
jgi:hypothetical protein